MSATRVWNYIKRGKVHPALVIGGPEREAKMTLAKGIAKHFFCSKKTDTSPFCGNCSSCRRIEKEFHPDLLLVREEGEDTIKIETIRHTCSQMALSHMEGPVKVCIIEECHRMTTASANAFLKTLEEPGDNRYFLLLTSQPNTLLPTILSRCLLFRLPPADEAVKLEGQDQPELQAVLEEFLQSRNAAAVVTSIGQKEKALQFVQFLQARLRETILAKETLSPRRLLLGEASQEALLSKFEATLKLEGRLRSNANYGLMLEDLLIQHF